MMRSTSLRSNNCAACATASQVLSVGSDQGRGCAVVVEVDDDLRFGRDLHVAVKFAAGSERRRIRCAFWQGFRLPSSFEKNRSGEEKQVARAAHEGLRVRRAGYSARGVRSSPATLVR